ncbi:hypothetical protein AnigIFM63326_001895 [Aspergillus niger]|nr:hypothetical protein AnigIFM63326_001895 [Aspergillus niger]
MSHGSVSGLPSPRAVDFDFTKKPEFQNLRQPARISLFQPPSNFPDSMFEPLEPHDATDSYFRAKVRFPATRDCNGDWAFLNMLLSKAIRRISFCGPIRNVNTYYYKDESALTPGALMLLTAHRVREGWVQVDISSSGGSLIATAYALCDSVHLSEGPMRPLGSPIPLRTRLNRAATEKFQDPFSDQS